MAKSLSERFFNFVIKGPDCWRWTGAKHPFGYGMIRDESSKKITASRASWLIHFGEPPLGMYVCHKCDNPECTNPEHLFLGTAKDNSDDMREKARGTAVLTPREMNAVRTLHSFGVSIHKLAHVFFVDRSAIKSAIRFGSIVEKPEQWKPAPKGAKPPPVHRGETNNKAKITESQVLEIRALRSSGMTTGEIAKRFPIGKSMVSHICTRRCWTHV